MRKLLSAFLTLCLICGLFALPYSVSAAAVTVVDFETDYQGNDNRSYYFNGNMENMTSYNNRGSYAEMVTEGDGNNAIRLTYDNGNNNENYNANPALNIYDSNTKSAFIGEAGQSYKIRFDVKIEKTGGQIMQFYVAACNRNTTNLNGQEPFYSTNLQLDHPTAMQTQSIQVVKAGNAFTAATTGYVSVEATYVATGVEYPIIALVTNDKNTVQGATDYASALVDNVTVTKVENLAHLTDYTLTFEETYKYTDDTVFYGNSCENWTNDGGRSSKAELATVSGNTAIRLTYKTGRDVNYKDNPAISIYNPKTSLRFIGEKDKKYVISMDVFAENTDGQSLQLYLVNCGRYSDGINLGSTDLNFNTSALRTDTVVTKTMGSPITENSTKWTRVYAQFVANGSECPLIVLSTNNSTSVSGHSNQNFASMLIDNISVKEDTDTSVLFHNYGEKDETISVYTSTTFAEINKPTKQGYYFGGFYKDAELTQKFGDYDLVSTVSEVYVCWLGDGNVVAPVENKNAMMVNNFQGVGKPTASAFAFGEYRINSMYEQAASNLVVEHNNRKWYGSYVITSEQPVNGGVNALEFDGLYLDIVPAASSAIFYLEVPDYEKAGATWGVALQGDGFVINQSGNWIWSDLSATGNKFYYMDNATGKWVESTVSQHTGILNLPSGYKGYIKFDFTKFGYERTVDFNNSYYLNGIKLRFNGYGGEAGDALFGGIFYAPSNNTQSTVMAIEGKNYNLVKSSGEIVVAPYNVNSSYTFATRFNGTAGTVDAVPTPTSSLGALSEDALGITSASGKIATRGYMNTYKRINLGLTMQPGSDTLMLYIEMPEYNSDIAPLKLLDMVISGGNTNGTLNFSNSIYKYMSVGEANWKIARAGGDGELYDIPSGFKGYIKFDLKTFKGIPKFSAVDLTKPYNIDTFELAFNHFGGNGGDFVIGGIYSVLADSDGNVLKHAMTAETAVAAYYLGDVDASAEIDTVDLSTLKNYLASPGTTDIFNGNVDGDIENIIDTVDLSVLKLKLAGGDNLKPDDGVVYKEIFTPDVPTTNTQKLYGIKDVTNYSAKIEADASLNAKQNAIYFADEVMSGKVADFEKQGIDKMTHVSTFIYANNNIYVSYYANTQAHEENPDYQVARLAYCPENDTSKKVVLDIQSVGDSLFGHRVVGVYDTIIMQKENDDRYLYVLWTANVAGQYYRLYRTFDMVEEILGEIHINKFKVKDTVNDFSTSGISGALTANKIGLKEMFTDIGIMQKLSSRVENGETYYYTGAYSGNFTCIIKSKDLITWEYVAQPNEGANGTGFDNRTKWENAVYVLNDKVYYFVRQWDPVYDGSGNLTSGSPYGILTYYDLITGEWETPVLVGDCQSRSDFIFYQGNLYLFYAPTDRNHIGILRIDTADLSKTECVLQANMRGSCFYPFIQYTSDGELAMSYTVGRRNIRLAKFTLSKYLSGPTAQTELSGKSILFLGDSIGAGWRDKSATKWDYQNGGGYSSRIYTDYGADVYNAASSGASFTTIPNRGKIINGLHPQKNNDFDYVVIQGGFNDAMGDNTKGSAYDNAYVAPVGTVSASKELAGFDTTTFAGALEEIFYYSSEYFPDAKLGFIITYQTPCSQYGGKTADVAAMREYWTVAKQICEKWGADYIDLFDGTTKDGTAYSTLLDVANSKSSFFPLGGDNIHLNPAGYDAVTPHIADWLIDMK